MSYVISQRIGSSKLAGFYTKIATEGDASRLVSSDTGYSEIQAQSDAVDEVLPSTKSLLYTLSFSYLVGAKQLMVFTHVAGQQAWLLVMEKSVAEQLSTYDVDTTLFFEEVDSTHVRLKNAHTNTGETNCDFLFMIPHTAIPSETREKITVKDQGNNEAIELEGYGDGVLLRSSNGSKWLIRVDDSGNLITESR